jgi:recyclin-1
MVFARVSRRLQEMVYDDSRWVTRLQLMGVWNEGEARKRFEDAMRKKRAADAAKHAEEEKKKLTENMARKGIGAPTTLFDVAEEQKMADEQRKQALRRAEGGKEAAAAEDVVGLQTAVGEMGLRLKGKPLAPTIRRDPESCLTVLETVRSVRGFARQEFGKVYGALATLYLDLVRAKTHTDPIIFRIFDTPEKQAKMLAQLWRFSGSDTTMGWAERIDRLKAMMEVFENAALREFEFGYEKRDIDGRMKRYANVLLVLNGGQSCIQLFVQKHSVLYERDELGNPMDCFEYEATFSAVCGAC